VVGVEPLVEGCQRLIAAGGAKIGASMKDHTLRVYDSVLEMASDEHNPTPLVRLRKVVPFQHTRVYAKLEWYNPFGAVKDRIAKNLLEDAEAKGTIAPGRTKLVEPTSGNTGLGLTMMANAKGYSVRTPLSNKIPLEKRIVLRFFGSDVVELNDELCPAPGAPEGAIAVARQMAHMPDWHMLDQYRNEANPESHYKTTGPEIWKQTGQAITHFAAGLGTCGTITGTGRFLKEKNPKVQVIGVHPAEGHDIPGVRSLKQLEQTELFRPKEYDAMVEVDNDDAYALCLRLVREESIIAGPSSGMALAGALRRVPDEPGNVLVVIFPDNVFKYASSMIRHFPDMFPDAGEDAAPTPPDPFVMLYDEMVRHAKVSPDAVGIDEALALMESQSAVVIDVRAPERFGYAHLPGAINIPLLELGRSASRLPQDKARPIVCVCDVGNISANGMLYLKSLGHVNVKSLSGSTRA
jgi:cysteine synthase/rhodanese-related sulfurtransferase